MGFARHLGQVGALPGRWLTDLCAPVVRGHTRSHGTQDLSRGLETPVRLRLAF
jgi:hypothetical protein